MTEAMRLCAALVDSLPPRSDERGPVRIAEPVPGLLRADRIGDPVAA